MTILIAVSLIALGALIGYLITNMVKGKVIQELTQRNVTLNDASRDYQVLKSRIRAFQDYGKWIGDEVQYNVQTNTGRFAKVFLPRV